MSGQSSKTAAAVYGVRQLLPQVIAAWEDFLQLKFITALVIKMPDPARQFIMEVGASEVGVGAVLSQKYSDCVKPHPYALFSQKTEANNNSDIGNCKLLAWKAS